MTARAAPRALTIPPGVPFLPALARGLMTGAVVPGFRHDGDPMALAEVTIFVPTRRAARELRSVFVEEMGGSAAILPAIRPLGEFEEDGPGFEREDAAVLDLTPPMEALDRVLLLAPLVRAWKGRIPATVAAQYEEGVVVPASTADAIWLARDLAALMDEIETGNAEWARLAGLVPEELAGWWQVTLEFLRIVTHEWPNVLAERARSSPAAHRNGLIAAEAARLACDPPTGPVIAAGSTGSIPATAELLASIARLPAGALVLPGLDRTLDARAWQAVGDPASPSACGHPQYGLKKLLSAIGIAREEVGELAAPPPALAARNRLVGEALRPAETTDGWVDAAGTIDGAVAQGALEGVRLVEAANEREEALAIAVALRRAIATDGAFAALVTPDRALARRVSSELARFGIHADDSGGSPLSASAAGKLLRLVVDAVFGRGDPVPVVGLLKHPLLRLGMPRAEARNAAETIDLVTLRGGTGRPDAAHLAALFATRRAEAEEAPRKPFWYARVDEAALGEARRALAALEAAIAPLAALRDGGAIDIGAATRASVAVLEAVARDEDGGLGELYAGEAGEALAGFLRGLAGADGTLECAATEWPDVLGALMAGETVKPPPGADRRVAIWGTLEARLQSVDTLVLGGLNEGTWPHLPSADRFMSRLMKSELELEPPERRVGQAAHDFAMAMGAPEVVLTRAVRAGNAPAVASRWLQRLTTCIGEAGAQQVRRRGRQLVAWARALDEGPPAEFAPRPSPTPPREARPSRFSVTEIETLRRDPYAIYARKILRLDPLDPLIRDPGHAERGTLFHEILNRFVRSGADPMAEDALHRLLATGREVFDAERLPVDVEAVWWPRFARTAAGFIDWERSRGARVAERHAEARAAGTTVGAGDARLSGYADRIDIRTDGGADILDYKTGASPSKRQAHTLLAPQLALEAALLARGAFDKAGAREAAELAYVRLKADGTVKEESILKLGSSIRTAVDMGEEAWARLERLLAHYENPEAGYLSRALPMREGDMEGDYDHLARVLEWSAGGDNAEGDGEGE